MGTASQCRLTMFKMLVVGGRNHHNVWLSCENVMVIFRAKYKAKMVANPLQFGCA
jgi:hypothetical protein